MDSKDSELLKTPRKVVLRDFDAERETMDKHEHKVCKHDYLRYCSKCDVVYCKDCEREWGAGTSYTPFRCTTTTSYPYEWTLLCGDDISGGTITDWQNEPYKPDVMTVEGGRVHVHKT